MQDADAANKAVANPTPIIDGRKANVNLAYLGAKPRPKRKFNFVFHFSSHIFLVRNICAGLRLPVANGDKIFL